MSILRKMNPVAFVVGQLDKESLEDSGIFKPDDHLKDSERIVVVGRRESIRKFELFLAG